MTKSLEQELADTKKELEDLQAEYQEFVYVVSHDLSAPFRQIEGFSKIIFSNHADAFDEKTKKHFDFINKANETCQNLLNALLDFSRLNTLAALSDPVDCNEVLALAEKHLSEEKIGIGATITYSKLPQIFGDHHQICQLFYELLKNALLYHKHGTRYNKLLHVEDDEADAFLIQEILKNEVGINSFEVVHVDSLKAALLELKEIGYDAVLLDLSLKDIDGLDNVEAIKQQNPDMPVVVLSGLDNDTVALAAINSGAQEYLVKGHCNGKVIKFAINSSIKRKFVERRLFKQANYDDLTGLPNRRLFEDYVARALDKAKRWSRRETLMFVDLDGFKAVNDELGHDAGNALLKEVAIRMTDALRQTDIIARYGGDEFTILLDDRSDDFRAAAGKVATKLLYAFNAPFEYGGKSVDFSASIGVAVYPTSGTDFSSLMKSADTAMYESKKAGGRQFRFAAL